MGHLKNLQQPGADSPGHQRDILGSYALKFTGRQSPGCWVYNIISPMCVLINGDTLLPPGQTITPRHFQQGAPGSHTLITSVPLTQTTSAFISGNHFQSLNGAPSSNVGGKASAFESE